MSIGLHHNGMHDYVLRELEIGTRAAMCEDSEQCGWNAINDLQYSEWCRQQPDWKEAR